MESLSDSFDLWTLLSKLVAVAADPNTDATNVVVTAVAKNCLCIDCAITNVIYSLWIYMVFL